MTQQSHSWTYIQKKTIIQKDTFTPMSTATLFTIAQTWKQTKYPLTEKWLKKLWYNINM